MMNMVLGRKWICSPDQFDMSKTITGVRWWQCGLAILLCLWSGLSTGFVTECYTSSSLILFAGSPKIRSSPRPQVSSTALPWGSLSKIIHVRSLGNTILVVLHVRRCSGTRAPWQNDNGDSPFNIPINPTTNGHIGDRWATFGHIGDRQALCPRVSERKVCVKAAQGLRRV